MLIYQNVSKYYEHSCLQNFLSLFMSLLTALIFKNSHILARIYFIFLTKRRRPKLKGFQYQIWTSVKRSRNYLLSKTTFNTFLHISCSSFRLKLWYLRVTKIVKQMQFEGAWDKLEAKNCLQRQPLT